MPDMSDPSPKTQPEHCSTSAATLNPLVREWRDLDTALKTLSSGLFHLRRMILELRLLLREVADPEETEEIAQPEEVAADGKEEKESMQTEGNSEASGSEMWFDWTGTPSLQEDVRTRN